MDTRAHLLSVDLEDWFTSAYLRHHVKPEECFWQIEESTLPILDLFDRKNVKTTFFVLGVIAEKHPQLIKEIARRGHEIASHGYNHTPLWQLTPEQFKHELQLTNNILQNITGKKVLGYRAAYASLDERTSWMIDMLEEEGFEYDSSIFPMKTILYGVNGAPHNTYRISSKKILQHTPGAKIIEIPFSVYRVGVLKIPVTGGIYGRLIPGAMLRYLLKQVAKNGAVNFYFHPWEAYGKTPRIKTPLFNQFISYYGAAGYLEKIEGIIDVFNFVTFEQYLKLNAQEHSVGVK
jgi:polysaccharide deacetylase family protein (PEP-CTERM system associated)